MPSHLRLQSTFEPVVANATYQTSPTTPPAKKQRMSLTQTYYVASTARSKLGKEAGKADHNLRRLVGHANLLDNLMITLADAEKEQEAWFNQSVKKASKPEESSVRHITWLDQSASQRVDSIDEDESDDDSEYDEDEDAALFTMIPSRIRAQPVTVEMEVDGGEDEDEDEDEDLDNEDDEEHALARVPSHSPPQLIDDESDSDSDEDSMMPPSPEQETFELSEKQKQQAMASADFYNAHSRQGLEDYVLQQAQAPMIAACAC